MVGVAIEICLSEKGALATKRLGTTVLNHRNSKFHENHSALTSLSSNSHDIYLVHDNNLFPRIVYFLISIKSSCSLQLAIQA